jgi:hypothetical protein
VSDPSDDVNQARVAAWLRDEGAASIPPEVAGRLHDVIAAEARSRATPGVVDLDAQRDVRAVTRADTQPGRRRWLLAASVAAIAALGALIVPPLLDGGADLLAGGGDDSAAADTDASEMEAQGLPEDGDADSDVEGTGQSVESAVAERAAIESLPPVPDEVAGFVLDPPDGAPLAAPGCGANLATRIDSTVRASAEVLTEPGGVVLLVDEPTTTAVWWLPSCESGPGQARGRTTGMPSP